MTKRGIQELGLRRGYFEIGIYHGKASVNLGTLWRSAFQLGASGIFTIGQRYGKQASDTVKAFRHVSLRAYETFDEFYSVLPYQARLVGVEMGGKPLSEFTHPAQAVYLLGAEDNGLPQEIIDRCHHIVSLEAVRVESYNVAVAGTLVMYNRVYG
jgi:tRNA G18 (ribose-2'-O)-methylase SpoU